MAWLSILLEASMGPRSNPGRITGHGNLVEASARCRIAGNTNAVSQSMVLVLRNLLFWDAVMACLTELLQAGLDVHSQSIAVDPAESGGGKRMGDFLPVDFP